MTNFGRTMTTTVMMIIILIVIMSICMIICCVSMCCRYSILSGDERMSFVMDTVTGVISLSNQRRQGMKPSYRLNVSVSDGVFTNTAQVVVTFDVDFIFL